jgi:hypothetical protein
MEGVFGADENDKKFMHNFNRRNYSADTSINVRITSTDLKATGDHCMDLIRLAQDRIEL